MLHGLCYIVVVSWSVFVLNKVENGNCWVRNVPFTGIGEMQDLGSIIEISSAIE